MSQPRAEAESQSKGPQEMAMADNRKLTSPGEKATHASALPHAALPDLSTLAGQSSVGGATGHGHLIDGCPSNYHNTNKEL